MSAVITHARAMLATFRASPWRTLHVRTGAAEMFFAKPGGDDSPMRAGMVPAAVPAAMPTAITAPHVATFVSAEPVGATVMAGQTVCRLELLGEPIEVQAVRAGRVAAHAVTGGALVEYGTTLITIA